GIESLLTDNSITYIEWPELYQEIFEQYHWELTILSTGETREYLLSEIKS
ncbi:MAG: hypothetical protein ACPF8V_08645, partial [Luteibaculum sp.]